jgi:hypothetical protein
MTTNYNAGWVTRTLFWSTEQRSFLLKLHQCTDANMVVRAYIVLRASTSTSTSTSTPVGVRAGWSAPLEELADGGGLPNRIGKIWYEELINIKLCMYKLIKQTQGQSSQMSNSRSDKVVNVMCQAHIK